MDEKVLRLALSSWRDDDFILLTVVSDDDRGLVGNVILVDRVVGVDVNEGVACEKGSPCARSGGVIVIRRGDEGYWHKSYSPLIRAARFEPKRLLLLAWLVPALSARS